IKDACAQIFKNPTSSGSCQLLQRSCHLLCCWIRIEDLSGWVADAYSILQYLQGNLIHPLKAHEDRPTRTARTGAASASFTLRRRHTSQYPAGGIAPRSIPSRVRTSFFSRI